MLTMSFDTALAAVGVGAAVGAHTATWGMYKDAPHEGFTWPKYGRSIAKQAEEIGSEIEREG